MTTETKPRPMGESPDQVRERIAPSNGSAPAYDISDAEIERRFTYHRPEGEKVGVHDDVREIFKTFAKELVKMVPAGREKSLAFTALEEAANWAHAGIARDGK